MSKENDDLLKSINKQMGKDLNLLKMGSDRDEVESMSTGSIAIDKAIGVGGLPCGRIVEIYGPEACGKTTITLGMIAEAQRNGKKCAFLDMEHALTPELARGCGVNMDELLFAQPDYGEQCLGVAEKLIESGKVSLLVIDSVAALVPKAELDGEMEDQQMGAQARMMGKGIRKIVSAANRSKCIVIFINQLREKLGVMFGNPEVTPGGKALKFAASVRIEARRKESITEKKEIIGNKVRVKIVKNKVDIPYRVAEVDLYYGKGIDNTRDIINIGVECGVITKKATSSYHSYNGSKPVNGIDAFIEWVKENDLFTEIDEKIRQKLAESPDPVTDNDLEKLLENDENDESDDFDDQS